MLVIKGTEIRGMRRERTLSGILHGSFSFPVALNVHQLNSGAHMPVNIQLFFMKP